MQYILSSVLRSPAILGETAVNEGSALDLDCDVSNSAPTPNVEWLSPQGAVLTTSRNLRVENILRTQTGTYKCVATDAESGDTRESPVDVVVQCKWDI